jgi:hypothetical protein
MFLFDVTFMRDSLAGPTTVPVVAEDHVAASKIALKTINARVQEARAKAKADRNLSPNELEQILGRSTMQDMKVSDVCEIKRKTVVEVAE